MITEEAISFPTAKLAKEKEFPQGGYSCFGDDGEIHSFAYFKISHPEENSYFQSTQTVLQKWLREIKNIDITILRSFSMNNSYHYFILVDQDYDNEIAQDCIPNRKYEQALEDALQEALKLINNI